VAATAQRAGIGAQHQDLLNAIAFACMAALGRPCRRISCALVRHQRAKDAGNITKLKTASSPSNNSGSRPTLTGGGARTVWADCAARKSAPLPQWLRGQLE
jgi:hypothetical protein